MIFVLSIPNLYLYGQFNPKVDEQFALIGKDATELISLPDIVFSQQLENGVKQYKHLNFDYKGCSMDEASFNVKNNILRQVMFVGKQFGSQCVFNVFYGLFGKQDQKIESGAVTSYKWYGNRLTLTLTIVGQFDLGDGKDYSAPIVIVEEPVLEK